MEIIVRILINAFAVAMAAYILPGISLANFWVAIMVVLVLGALNIFVKPIILLFTLPINLLTLGFFTLVINAFIIMMASFLIPGFWVAGFISALMFSIVLAIFNMVLEVFV